MENNLIEYFFRMKKFIFNIFHRSGISDVSPIIQDLTRSQGQDWLTLTVTAKTVKKAASFVFIKIS